MKGASSAATSFVLPSAAFSGLRPGWLPEACQWDLGDWGRGFTMQDRTHDAERGEGGVEIEFYDDVCPCGSVEAQLGSRLRF